MKKRSCERFNIPGTTLYYKCKPSFFKKHSYSKNYFPVIDLSKGGANFLCDERLQVGKSIIIKINIPGEAEQPEIFADVRWIAKNPEKSYRYQTGIAYSSYGNRKNENPAEILAFFKSLEKKIKNN